MTYKEALANMKNKCNRAIEESLIMIEGDAKLLCPVLSGTLKRSISHSIENNDNEVIGTVGSNVEYAYWAERKAPYLEPSVDKNIENIKRKIGEVLSS